MSDLSLSVMDDSSQVRRRRTRRDPKPRFKPDITRQLDAVAGCPALQVPEGHLAREVQRVVDRLDLNAVEAKYSSLGRHGYSPRSLLAVWVYASIIGVHRATQVARLLVTDAAFRFLSGGYSISRPRVNRFRLENRALFEDAVAQTVAQARSIGLLPLDELAVDSMRLRAHGSFKETRTLARSRERLEELRTVDIGGLTESDRREHEAKVARHTRTVEECTQGGRTSVVATNPLAALIQFPDGGAAPGHRVTAVGAGARGRIIVAVLVTADTTDVGLLAPALDAARSMLRRAGVPDDAPLQGSADAGYSSLADLVGAEQLRERGTDVLIDAKRSHGVATTRRFFRHDRFDVRDGKIAICPAGTAMRGPKKKQGGFLDWTGVGCQSCPIRSQCTDGKSRTLTLNPQLERLRADMLARLATDDGDRRYRRRFPTIEPIFSNLESTMGFRRASSRNERTVAAEVMLKVLAHNVSRLLAARPLRLVFCEINETGELLLCSNEF